MTKLYDVTSPNTTNPVWGSDKSSIDVKKSGLKRPDSLKNKNYLVNNQTPKQTAASPHTLKKATVPFSPKALTNP